MEAGESGVKGGLPAFFPLCAWLGVGAHGGDASVHPLRTGGLKGPARASIPSGRPERGLRSPLKSFLREGEPHKR